MELKNSIGDSIVIDDRYDLDKIRDFIKNNEHSALDDYLSEIQSFPSHKNGGIDLSFGDSGVSFARNGATIMAANGLVLPAITINNKANE